MALPVGYPRPRGGWRCRRRGSGQAILRGDVVEEGGARARVGVDEDEPIAGGGFGAATSARPIKLMGLEDDVGAGGAGDFRGAIGGVVCRALTMSSVSCAAPGEGGHGIGVTWAKGFAEELFLVERGRRRPEMRTQWRTSKSRSRTSGRGGKKPKHTKRPSSREAPRSKFRARARHKRFGVGISPVPAGGRSSRGRRCSTIQKSIPSTGPVNASPGFVVVFAADDGQRLDGFGGDGVDGVEALGEEGLEFLWVGGLWFGQAGWRGCAAGFDDFFVEPEPFAIARGCLLEGFVDDARDGVEAARCSR